MQVRPFYAAALSREDAEGTKTSREALLVGVWFEPGVGLLENQELMAAARCLGRL